MRSKKNIKQIDEIDLVETIFILWEKKFKIFLILILSLMLTFVYQKSVKTTLVGTTEIKSISEFEEFKYIVYNRLLSDRTNNYFGLDQINKSYLLKLFIEKLNEKHLFIKGIKKFDLVNEEIYETEQEYEEAIKKLASSIKVHESTYLKETKGKNNQMQITEVSAIFPKIIFETQETLNWQNFLEFVRIEANEEVRLYVNEHFKSLITYKKKLDELEIEDINLKIKLANEDYEIGVEKKLAFLSQQNAIARALSIEKNTMEAQTFSGEDGGIVTNLQLELPYYTKGYAMIEKEIDELILNRKSGKAFDAKLNELKKEKLLKIENKDIERIEEAFNLTPILDQKNFQAAQIMFLSTQYNKKNNTKSMSVVLFLGGLLGTILGIFYILIENSIRNRK